MATEQDGHVDERLREVFAVAGETATRVATRALAGPRRRRRARRWSELTARPLRASLGLATVAVCAGIAVCVSRPAIVKPPAPPAVTGSIQLSGCFVDGVLIVALPGDAVMIASPERRDDRPRDGSGIVLVEGEGR